MTENQWINPSIPNLGTRRKWVRGGCQYHPSVAPKQQFGRVEEVNVSGAVGK
jgi:hypothetical protein